MLRAPAQQRARQAGCEAEKRQLQRIKDQRFAARQAEAAQQGTGIEAPRGKARSGQGDRDTGQQHRSEAGEVQVLLGAAEGAADLAIAVSGGLDTLVWL